MSNPFDEMFGGLNQGKQKDSEMKTRIVKLEDSIIKHRTALQTANGLLKECIRRIELLENK